MPHSETDGGIKHIEFVPFVILVLLITSGTGYGLYRLSRLYFETPAPSVAVLPFLNLSQSPDDEYFSDGLTEEIQSLLVRVNEFQVVALNSTVQLKNTDLDMRKIAKRLSVDLSCWAHRVPDVIQSGTRRSATDHSLRNLLININLNFLNLGSFGV